MLLLPPLEVTVTFKLGADEDRPLTAEEDHMLDVATLEARAFLQRLAERWQAEGIGVLQVQTD
jgi:hypothetical protein